MIRPLRDWLLVEIDPEHETPAGIVVIPPKATKLVDSRRQYGHRATVLQAGPGRRTRKGAVLPTQCRAGDVVRFGEFMHRELPDEQGRRLALIQEADVTLVEAQ